MSLEEIRDNLRGEIFKIENQEQFNRLSLEVFRYQAECNSVYREYISLLDLDVNSVKSVEEIPFLPVRFFKNWEIISGDKEAEIVFTSSSTTGMVPAKHYVTDLSLYRESFIAGFNKFYGNPSNYVFLALLPSYLERKGSSLVYMAQELIDLSKSEESGFYLYNHKELYDVLNSLNERGEKVVLLGVSFALLDFVANYSINFPNLIVIETGGMKGRGEELSREELHSRISKGFGVKEVHSEYGMAELLSQAYSVGDGVFNSPNWMKVVIRNLYNPFEYYLNGADSPLGGVNIIDLANINSCSFIETEDLGYSFSNGSFTIEGRIKESELRGCNMLL